MFHDLSEKEYAPFRTPGTITRAEAVSLIQESGKNSFFSVSFTKRSDGEFRKMTCRQGVKIDMPGAPWRLPYNLAERNLISVFGTKENGYRSIPIEGIIEVKIRGKVYKVE
jgi:hypothetical protein